MPLYIRHFNAAQEIIRILPSGIYGHILSLNNPICNIFNVLPCIFASSAFLTLSHSYIDVQNKIERELITFHLAAALHTKHVLNQVRGKYYEHNCRVHHTSII